jgi:hypothetical protein
MAHTIEEERRQGLASNLNIKFAEKVFQIQDHVFGVVIRDNRLVCSLTEKSIEKSANRCLNALCVAPS